MPLALTLRGCEATDETVCPSVVALLCPFDGQSLGAFALCLMDGSVALVAQALKVLVHECPLAHLLHRVRVLDGVDVVHLVGSRHDSLLLAYLAEWIGPQLPCAQLSPLP